MESYLTTIAESFGISVFVLLVFLLWSTVWKLLGLWKSARKGSVIWFIALAIFNTFGILEILYIFWFSEMKCCKAIAKPKKKVKKRK